MYRNGIKRLLAVILSLCVDGSLSDELAAQYPYVYNDITKALSADALKNGTADKPMTVYVAPYVYWIDDPAATDTVQKTEGYSVPYGMVAGPISSCRAIGTSPRFPSRTMHAAVRPHFMPRARRSRWRVSSARITSSPTHGCATA